MRIRRRRAVTPEDWFEEIEDGLAYRRDFGLEDQWASIEAMFYSVSDHTRSGPNLIYSTGDAFLASITGANPRVMIRPKMGADPHKAPILESVDNELVKELELEEAIATASLHAYLWGTGFLKFGYDSEYGWEPLLDVGLDQGMPLGATMSQFNEQGKRIEFSSMVRPGWPWGLPVLPHDIVAPWGVTGVRTSPWIAHRIVRHVDDVKADVKYENTGNLQPNISAKAYTESYLSPIKITGVKSGRERASSKDAGNPEFVELWEISDLRDGHVKTISSEHKKFLRNEPDELLLNGILPFAELNFVPRTRSLWTTPDAHYLMAAQIEEEDIAKQSQKQRRCSVLKFLYQEGMIDDEELERALSSGVGLAVKVKPAGGPIKEVIQSLSFPNNNQALQIDSEYNRRGARELVGFSRNQMGEFMGGRKTAREVLAVREGNTMRMGRRQKAVKKLYLRSIAILNEMVFRYWTTPRYAEVVGEGGAMEWVQYTGQTLAGPWSYEVQMSVEEEMTKSERELAALQLYQQLAADPAFDPIELRQFLTDSFNDQRISNIFSGGGQNANLPVQMQGMRQGGGKVSAQNPQQAGGLKTQM